MYDLVSKASFERPEYVPPNSGWLDYAPLAFWIIDAIRPGCVVELGVHYGFSYFSFCQQIKKLGLSSCAFAVDHWAGDAHSGHYDSDVLEQVKEHNKRYHPFSVLVQSTFEEFAANVPDGCIDLLHIDGYHSYEAVSADYAAYQKKLSDDAVVMFHDTNWQHLGYGDKLDYGVSRFFNEISAGHPSFEFMHGCGLGLFAPNKAPPAFEALCNISAPAADWIEQVYSVLGYDVMTNTPPSYGIDEIDLVINATRKVIQDTKDSTAVRQKYLVQTAITK